MSPERQVSGTFIKDRYTDRIVKNKWFLINLALSVGVLVSGWMLWRLSKTEGVQPFRITGRADAVNTAEAENLRFDDAVRFRIKVHTPCRGEAVLVEPGPSLKFTLRPYLDVPSHCPTPVLAYIETFPRLNEKIRIEWKSDGGGKIVPRGEGRYEYVLPEEGGDITLRFRGVLSLQVKKKYKVRFEGQTSLKLVCPIPWERIPEEKRTLIGRYPIVGKNSKLAPYRSFYKRPSHFYRVTRANENWKISPHFRVGDFDLHFDYTTPESPEINQFPQYIALSPKVVVKLERILIGLRENGVEVETLGVLAGYRSPAYNAWKKKQSGGGGKYTKGLSTHMYGAAVDFYVDADGDGIMDDLNGDGVCDMEDSVWVRDRVVDAIDCQASKDRSGLAGMCGVYGDHDIPDRFPQSPNLHVDIRGYSINRWYINPRGKMVTDWGYWDRKNCSEILSATKSSSQTPAGSTRGETR